MRNTRFFVLILILLLAGVRQGFGHACDDPWRPDPSNVGSPGAGGPGAPGVAPPPPPPAPGQVPSGNDPLVQPPPGMINQLPQDVLNPGGGANMSPDNIVLIPETSQLKIVGKKGEFRTYIVNRSPRDLFAVKLEAMSPAFEIKVVPDTIRRLVSGEKDYYTVKLKMKGKLKSGKFPMDFKVSSRGNLIYEGSLGDQAGAKKTAAKDNLGIRMKGKSVKLAQSGGFTVFIKNNIYNEVNQVKVEVNSKYFDVKCEPKSVAKLSPGREAKFKVNLTRKKGVKPGKYDIRLHAITSSRNVRSNKMITVQVVKSGTQKAGK